MSDAIRNAAPGQGGSDVGDALRQSGQELKTAVGEARSQAGEAAARAGEEAKGLAREAADEGREVAATAVDRAESLAEDRKRAGADQAEGVARAIRRAADELQDTAPTVAGYVRDGADHVQQAAMALRQRSLRDLIGGVEGFAREQPVAFFGAAVLAGLVLSRFAKSSVAGGAYHPRDGHHSAGLQTTATAAPGWTPDADDDRRGQRDAHPATMAAATLGGTAARPTVADDARSRNSEEGRDRPSPTGGPSPSSPPPTDVGAPSSSSSVS